MWYLQSCDGQSNILCCKESGHFPWHQSILSQIWSAPMRGSCAISLGVTNWCVITLLQIWSVLSRGVTTLQVARSGLARLFKESRHFQRRDSVRSRANLWPRPDLAQAKFLLTSHAKINGVITEKSMKIKYNNNLESKHSKGSVIPSLASHKEIKAKTSII